MIFQPKHGADIGMKSFRFVVTQSRRIVAFSKHSIDFGVPFLIDGLRSNFLTSSLKIPGENIGSVAASSKRSEARFDFLPSQIRNNANHISPESIKYSVLNFYDRFIRIVPQCVFPAPFAPITTNVLSRRGNACTSGVLLFGGMLTDRVTCSFMMTME